ncbi:ArnT family glycosyltransferase [Amycolatopsis sp. CA-126428]|uniref:ArnT family glycosyltransferase n=1 Tax=Amycolatopsis sp. CA-126428 TaxID=2073158 RepID=UPI001E319D62|nr:glycosyltransferase family 39 protein [Amycolatopsis sp. CA-126428]
MITEATREDGPPAAGGRPPGRWRRWLTAFAVAGLLAGMAAAMITTAVAQTPTIDEPVYVGAAIFSLEHHSLRFNPEHPPLGKLIIATGLAFADVHVDAGFAGDQTGLGRSVLYEQGHDPGRLMLLARLPVIVLTLLFGLVVFAFARDLAGPAGGLVALALYALSPDLVAHGSLATLDVPVAGFLVTSAWLLWRARRRPVRYLPLAGLALGAAVATKMSALAAVPVALLLVVLSVCASGPQRTLRRLGAGAAAALGVALIAVGVVWVRTWWSIRGCAGCHHRACRRSRGCARSRACCRCPGRTSTGCASSSASKTRCGRRSCSAAATSARCGTTSRPRCW